MKHRKLIGLVIAAGAVIAGLALFGPLGEWLADDDSQPSAAGEFGSVVSVNDVEIALPQEAGGAAAIYFTATNRGDRGVYISEVLVEHGSRAQFFDLERQVPDQTANIDIPAGETVQLEPGDPVALLTDYDANIVPGAQVDVRFDFGTGTPVTVPATVIAARADTGVDRRQDVNDE